MRLIADGTVERDGVPGLATRLGCSPGDLDRVLTAELGAGALALAREHRARTARTLLEMTALPMAEVAFAAGFPGAEQLATAFREVFATTPSRLRARVRPGGGPGPDPGTMSLLLRYRAPFDADGLFAFLAARELPGVERVGPASYTRALLLEHGPAVVALHVGPDGPRATLRLTDPRDVVGALARLRRLADLDADPETVDGCLAGDPLLAASLAAVPGIRLPGTVDGGETLLRGILGQQVSVAAARTAAARLAAELGEPLPPALLGEPGVERLFPTPAVLAERGAQVLRGPARRTATVLATAAALADGSLDPHPGRDPEELRRELVGRPGLGPWTAGYALLRILGSTDELLTGDLVLRRGASHLGLPTTPSGLAEHARRWRPWRSYAGMHLWRAGAPSAAPNGDHAVTPRGDRPGDRPSTTRRRSAFEHQCDRRGGPKASGPAGKVVGMRSGGPVGDGEGAGR